MTKCTVEHHHSAILVKFEDGKSYLIQVDYDQTQFAVDCGMIVPPEKWDGDISSLVEELANCELSDITECPLLYYEIAE